VAEMKTSKWIFLGLVLCLCALAILGVSIATNNSKVALLIVGINALIVYMGICAEFFKNDPFFQRFHQKLFW